MEREPLIEETEIVPLDEPPATPSEGVEIPPTLIDPSGAPPLPGETKRKWGSREPDVNNPD